MRAFLSSQAFLTLLGILAVYFSVKTLAVALKLWTPQHRLKTLDAPALHAWRIAAALEAAGLALIFFALLAAQLAENTALYLLCAAGAVLFAAAKTVLIRKFPYMDPETVKKSGKKKKK